MHDLQDPLPDPPADATTMPFTLSELHGVRTLVEEQAQRAGLSSGKRHALVLAVDELATNSIKHAGGGGELRIWATGDTLLCEIHDHGRLADPLAARTKPDSRTQAGWGLWLVNQLCELTQIRTGDGGTTVRLQMSRSPTAD